MDLKDIKAPTAVFFQPARYLPMLANEYGVTVAFGPEVENARALPPDVLLAREVEWMNLARSLGVGVVVKRPWKYASLPDNVVGVMHTQDEPNAKKIPPSAMQAEAEQLRLFDLPVFLSLFGGAVTSANLGRVAELQLLNDYAALCDIATLDAYPANINASRHKMTWTGDAVEKWIANTGRPAWAWVEINDQQLPSPKPADGINRAPTADEIKATVDYAVAKGASGIGWFATAQNGKYGWGIIDPAKGDSYWPLVDRTGASIRPQLDMVKAIGQARKPVVTPPPPPVDPIAARIAALESQVTAAAAAAAAANAKADAVSADVALRFDELRKALARPTTQPV